MLKANILLGNECLSRPSKVVIWKNALWKILNPYLKVEIEYFRENLQEINKNAEINMWPRIWGKIVRLKDVGFDETRRETKERRHNTDV